MQNTRNRARKQMIDVIECVCSFNRLTLTFQNVFFYEKGNEHKTKKNF